MLSVKQRVEALKKLEGKLSVFEGEDRTGKTSVSQLLHRDLTAEGLKTIWTRRPGGAYGEHSETFRHLAKKVKLDPVANFLTFLADAREQLTKEVAPALREGLGVISDRWSYSTVAYQFYGMGLNKVMPLEVMEWALGEVFNPDPDFVFWFPETLAIHREVDPADNFETQQQEFFERVRVGYTMAKQMDDSLLASGGAAPLWITVTPGFSVEETLENLLTSLLEALT